MKITREKQLEILAEALPRLKAEAGISRLQFEKIAGVKEGSIRDFIRGKLPMRADKWQKISEALNNSQSKVFQVDLSLMQKCTKVISDTAKKLRRELTRAEELAYSVKLYNHVMKYRAQNPEYQPDEPSAELILMAAKGA